MWMKVPYFNMPIPATKAVKEIQLYRGEGIQPDDGYFDALDRNGDRLFHVVTDYYLAAFLPMVGEVLPKLTITFKNRDGEVVGLDDCIIKSEGKEFKVWEAVSRFAADLKEMPDVYRQKQNRIQEERGIPLVVWTVTGLVLLAIGIVAIIRTIIRKRKNK
jgi:hypothetical protein